jgi:hypothetical protein
MKMTRDEMISILIDDMMNTATDSRWYLASICSDGFKGYHNYTDEELRQEYDELLAIDGSKL